MKENNKKQSSSGFITHVSFGLVLGFGLELGLVMKTFMRIRMTPLS